MKIVCPIYNVWAEEGIVMCIDCPKKEKCFSPCETFMNIAQKMVKEIEREYSIKKD